MRCHFATYEQRVEEDKNEKERGEKREAEPSYTKMTKRQKIEAWMSRFYHINSTDSLRLRNHPYLLF